MVMPVATPEHEVDAEQRAPEFRHLPPDRAAGHDIDRLHDRHEDRQTQRQRHEQEVIHGCHRKLQARQLDDIKLHRGAPLEYVFQIHL
jgi:hypothetical protein